MHNIRPFIPHLFTEPGTLFYIGARADAHSWLFELSDVGHQIVILEVWPENVEGLIHEIEGRKIWVAQGDVRENTAYPLGLSSFDYTFWWHGPEHLSENEITSTLKILEAKTKKLICLACPWGVYPQGSHKGNPYEEHKTTLYPWFFKGLGYEVQTDGEVDQPGSEIVAWKEIG